jgi:hypothetical protein
VSNQEFSKYTEEPKGTRSLYWRHFRAANQQFLDMHSRYSICCPSFCISFSIDRRFILISQRI